MTTPDSGGRKQARTVTASEFRRQTIAVASFMEENTISRLREFNKKL